jgi:uncharacterized protein (DUF58 family)
MGSLAGAGVGQSIEFMDYRAYEPGDDTRSIDWSAYARTDKLMIRRRQEEVSPYLDIILDASRSMDLPGTPKADAAIATASCLLTAGLRAGYSPTIYRLGERCVPIGDDLSGWDAFDAPTPDLAVSRLKPRAGGARILITDLLAPKGPSSTLRGAATGVRWLGVVQILSQQDIEVPPPGPVRLRDHETGELLEVQIDADTARRFAQRVIDHAANCAELCRGLGASFATIIAEDAVRDHYRPTELARAGVLIPQEG